MKRRMGLTVESKTGPKEYKESARNEKRNPDRQSTADLKLHCCDDEATNISATRAIYNVCTTPNLFITLHLASDTAHDHSLHRLEQNPATGVPLLLFMLQSSCLAYPAYFPQVRSRYSYICSSPDRPIPSAMQIFCSITTVFFVSC